MDHEIIWTQPPPLWATPGVKFAPRQSGVMRRPDIFRFTSDSFMEVFMDVLANEPGRLKEFTVQPETWRGFTAQPDIPKRKPASAVLRHLRIFRRVRPNGLDSTGKQEQSRPPSSPNLPLKLYQPAHQRHYIVASGLVCKVPGLPDRTVNTANDERAGFVMRRLLPPANHPDLPVADWEEHAWIPGTRGNSWQRVPGESTGALMGGEELLPMFGVRFDEPDHPSRRLFAGVIPVGKREAYLGAPKSNDQPQPGVTSHTARKILLRKEVIEPWKSLVARAQQVRASLAGPFRGEDRAPTLTERINRLKIEREQIQTVSWLILLDFARYLSTYLKPVWRAVLDPGQAGELNGAERNVFVALENSVLKDDPSQLTVLNPNSLRELVRHRPFGNGTRAELYSADAVPRTLRDALAQFGDASGGISLDLERLLESVVQPYDRNNATRRAAWPSFVFPLADPERPNDAPVPPILSLGTLTEDERGDLDLDEVAAVNDPVERIDKLAVLIVRALEDHPVEPAPEPDVPTAAIPPANALEGWFVIRCIYDRSACAPFEQAVVSEPTEPFQLAGFFDPDAPARPIRIGLPLDTTPAGLRKFDKNTAFVISNTLCGQIRRMKGLTLGDLVRSVLPWPLHKDLSVPDSGPCKTGSGIELGMICSLSIPIITLCALLLLMIIVSLLDIIFRWLPFFILCFPIPGLKGKR